MKLSILLSFGVGFAVVCTTCLAQEQSGKLIDFSMKATVQMPGVTMPPQITSRKVCTAPDKFDPQALLHEGSDCKISDYRENGGTIAFHVACTGPHAGAGVGTFHRQVDGSIDGTMRLTMPAAGGPVTVDTIYQGKLAGSCEYRPAAG